MTITNQGLNKPQLTLEEALSKLEKYTLKIMSNEVLKNLQDEVARINNEYGVNLKLTIGEQSIQIA